MTPIRITLTIFALLFASASYAFAPAMRFIFIDFSGFRKIGNIYFQEEITRQDQDAALDLILQAKRRIASTFGPTVAAPSVIIVNTDENAKKYGLNDTPAAFFFTAWGGNYLVVDINKSKLDVIAHEFTHAEIAARLGYTQRADNFATWLDEGIALQVDDRPHYAFANLRCTESEMNRVRQLLKPSDFWSADRDMNLKNYQAAKCAAHDLFKRIPILSLYPHLERIRDGEKYADVLKGF